MEVFLKELEFVIDERQRRARNQFSYIRLNLVNVGIMFFLSMTSNAAMSEKFVKNTSLLEITISSLMTFSIILFLFWADDAFTIAGTDKYPKSIETEYKIRGWYLYRDTLNTSIAFILKSHFFSAAVLLSFVAPPILASIILYTNDTLDLARIIFAGEIVILASIFIMWRRFSKGIYTPE